MSSTVHILHNDLYVNRTEGTCGNTNTVAELKNNERSVNSADAKQLIGRLCADKSDIRSFVIGNGNGAVFILLGRIDYLVSFTVDVHIV